ncbi:TPA: DNA cytosine methyltransferase, partial [Pasteurella multocida]|nr:DNA cytosine methyltransferase [Pasteurella multocida]
MKKTTFSQFINMSLPHSDRFNFISLFSSAGIADYGLTMAGGKCLAACEIDLNRRKTHQENFDCPVFEDIQQDRDKIVKKFKNQDIDVVIATPPCQGFSTANSARGNRKDYLSAERDSRNILFLDAIYIAQKLKPKFIIFENVPN